MLTDMKNQSPPMGRMLRRAIPEEYNLHNTGSLWNWFYREISNDECTLVRWRSLNTTGVQFRVRQLEWDCKRLRKGLGELYTPDEQNAHLAKPVTKKDILDGYLASGRYCNFKTPKP